MIEVYKWVAWLVFFYIAGLHVAFHRRGDALDGLTKQYDQLKREYDALKEKQA
jgi:hypothetical protein